MSAVVLTVLQQVCQPGRRADTNTCAMSPEKLDLLFDLDVFCEL